MVTPPQPDHAAERAVSDPPSPGTPGSARRWRRPSPVVILVALLALAGVVLLQLPSIATWFSQRDYSQEIMGLNRESSSADEARRQTALAAARAYNEQLTGAAVVAAGQRIPQAVESSADEEYTRLLAADSTGLMARIKIPSIDVDLPIYHGTSDDVLEQGVGHLEGTALPVGGPTTHTVLTAHRGLAKAALFDNLDQVQEGDTFTVETWGEVLTYRVTETQVVKPDETQSLYPVLGEDLATLVTCTPLGINTHRILVTGERVTPTPIGDLNAAGEDPTVPGFPWWAVWSALALTGITGYVVASCRVRTRASDAGRAKRRPAHAAGDPA
nr:class C sortase [Leucobacter chromiireducens]